MEYRREIDGLRALAVVPVILFHAGFTLFSGGYVGVDIFFVISGYLITSILINDLAQGKFSILRFYERRARRILPALFFVMLCCIPFAWMWMLPVQFKAFSQSMVAVTVFVSNVLFWSESGYFQATSEEKPLLHTWSLAVEEQYYLIFPVFLFLMWRFGRNPVFYSIIAIALISLALSEWGVRNKPTANFYLAPTRMWELLAGSICAFLHHQRPRKSSNLGSILGLAAILFSIFFYDRFTPFPSLYALLPVVGTALIILYGTGETWAGRILTQPAFVGIGLISYSAYLWHQPLFAFARIRSVQHPEQWLMITLALLSLGLAYLSWRFVEQPFRKKDGSPLRSQNAVFCASGVVGAAFIAFGVYGHMNDGIDSRKSVAGVSFAELNIDAKLAENYGLDQACTDRFTVSDKCATGPNPEILLWGDSFAMHMAQALTAHDDSPHLRQHTMPICAPILGVAMTNNFFGRGWARGCIHFNEEVLEWLRASDSTRYVVISSALQLLNTGILTVEGELVTTGQFERAVEGMRTTIEKIVQTGKKPVVISPPPRNGHNIGKCLSAASALDFPDDTCDFTTAEYSGETLRAYEFMDRISEFVPVIMLEDYICTEGGCRTNVDGTFIYRDDAHLAKEGSRMIGMNGSLLGEIRTRANDFFAAQNL